MSDIETAFRMQLKYLKDQRDNPKGRWNVNRESDIKQLETEIAKIEAEKTLKAAQQEKFESEAWDHNYPSPIAAAHIYGQMSKNFPASAIEWVKHAKWVGPYNVPWDSVDTDNIDQWAASHQPEHVKKFEKSIKDHSGDVAPSILLRERNSKKSFIVDGHHRALAHKNLNQPVLGYVGELMDEKYRQSALETHAKQVHSGSDPRNK